MFFAAPPEIEAKLFTRVPDHLRVTDRPSPWARQRHGARGSFLEGPAFDRHGNLYLVDIAFGRIFRVTPDGTFTVVTEYDGEPNGLKIHRDGRLFVTDRRHGIVVVDAASGGVTPVLERAFLERFKGTNDLVFADNGDLYFTDQGETGLHDPTGRLYRLRADGRLECVLDNVPSPNGLVLNPEQTILYLAATRANAVWRVPLLPDGNVIRVGVFVQLSGGLGGPDGLAIDEEGNLAIAHAGLGTVWLLSRLGEPLYRIRCSTGVLSTNVAYGGPDRRTLYITESHSGSVLTARLDVPGRVMYSHRD